MRTQAARSLGRQLLDLAQDYTRDLDQAHYLVRLTAEAVIDGAAEADDVALADCRVIMRRKARECGLLAGA